MTLSEYWWYKDSYMRRMRLKNFPIVHLCNLLVSSGMTADAKLDINDIYPVYTEKEVLECEDDDE